jgi:hypothetical protein
VSLCGGEFSAGPLEERGFRVTARFPLPARPLPTGPSPARAAAAQVPAAVAKPAGALSAQALPRPAR